MTWSRRYRPGEYQAALHRPPDDAQAAMLDRLGIVLPRRMRADQLAMPATLIA
jgi:hypothetical protein